MANLTSVKKKITVESSRFLSAVSEFLIQTMGKSINYLIDKTDSIESAVEGQTLTNVVAVSQNGLVSALGITYTVPASTTFFGAGFVEWEGETIPTSVTINSSDIGSITVTPTGENYINYPMVLTAGQSVTVSGNPNGGLSRAKIRGIAITSTTISIP